MYGHFRCDNEHEPVDGMDIWFLEYCDVRQKNSGVRTVRMRYDVAPKSWLANGAYQATLRPAVLNSCW